MYNYTGGRGVRDTQNQNHMYPRELLVVLEDSNWGLRSPLSFREAVCAAPRHAARALSVSGPKPPSTPHPQATSERGSCLLFISSLPLVTSHKPNAAAGVDGCLQPERSRQRSQLAGCACAPSPPPAAILSHRCASICAAVARAAGS